MFFILSCSLLLCFLRFSSSLCLSGCLVTGWHDHTVASPGGCFVSLLCGSQAECRQSGTVPFKWELWTPVRAYLLSRSSAVAGSCWLIRAAGSISHTACAALTHMSSLPRAHSRHSQRDCGWRNVNSFCCLKKKIAKKWMDLCWARFSFD